MRGARVEVRNGSATATGRLLSVEKEHKANGKGDFYDATEFSIVSDTGEMKHFDLDPGTSVRLADRPEGSGTHRTIAVRVHIRWALDPSQAQDDPIVSSRFRKFTTYGSTRCAGPIPPWS